MNNPSTYYTDLISRYLSEECTFEEVNLLTQWIEANPENKKRFEEYSKTWSLIDGSRIDQEVDTDLEWHKLESKISFQAKPEKKTVQINFHSVLLRIAAVFLLLALPSLFIIRYITTPGIKELSAQNQVTENNLPDGTVVSLNKGATIEYPERFKGKTRDVKLKGEAFFQVQHEKFKPFIISSGNIAVEVLGTTFYINTDAGNGKMNVILSNGSVAVYYKEDPSRRIVLKPGEKAEISIAGNEINKIKNEDPNYLAWKTGTLIFNGDPMSVIIPTLNKIYHSDIRLTGSNISGCRVTATFTGQPLDAVLNVLKATLDLQIKYTGATIELSGNGCK